MKAKWVHHAWEWIEGDFAGLTSFTGDGSFRVLSCRRNDSMNMTAMKLKSGGTAIWGHGGELIHHFPRGADLAFVGEHGKQLLSLENQFGETANATGVSHLLRRLDLSDFGTIQETTIVVPTGGVEFLVTDSKREHGLATWLDQTEWGYILLDLKTMAPRSDGLRFPVPSICPPELRADSNLVVACSPYRDGWWTDAEDDYWESESPGGWRKVGVVTVHDLLANFATNHDVLVNLPQGWRPDRGELAEWQAIWGPRFVSENEFLMWLPDHSVEKCRLPLPPTIRIEHSLSTVRDCDEED